MLVFVSTRVRPALVFVSVTVRPEFFTVSEDGGLSSPSAPDAAPAPGAAPAAPAAPTQPLSAGDTARVFYSREKAKWNDRLGKVISVDPKKKRVKLCMLEGPAKVLIARLVFLSVV